MSSTMQEYFDALDRLIINKPIRVPKGTKISNDAISLESGRKKGSIKKGRAEFEPLIKAINEAKKIQKTPLQKSKEESEKYKVKYEDYRQLYEEALNRELMMIERIDSLEKELREIKAKNPLRKA